ncbi:MAG: carbohydrate ABC transporter permease [Saccharofermentans sp.]|nr:carbohydrate ABC transporter permease [Saccharofermentans sp.]
MLYGNARCIGTGSVKVNGSAVKDKDTVLRIVVYALSIAVALLMFFPFVGLVTGDLTVPVGYGTEVYKLPYEGIIDYWKQVVLFFDSASFTGFKNSVIVTVTSTVFCMYVSSITAYAITAYEWKLRETFDKLIMVIVLIPSTVSTIGFYQLVWKFHMINRLSMLIIPAIASPLTVLFMRLYLKATFSKEIVESARIDGAGEFRIFNQIILPLLKPAIATQAIFCFVTSWYNYLVPAIILIAPKKKTIAVADSSNLLLYLLPPVLVYAFLSKYIVEGIALGSVKN